MPAAEAPPLEHLEAAAPQEPGDVLFAQQERVLEVQRGPALEHEAKEVRRGEDVELARLQEPAHDVEEAGRVVHVLERVRVHDAVDLLRKVAEVLDVPGHHPQARDAEGRHGVRVHHRPALYGLGEEELGREVPVAAAHLEHARAGRAPRHLCGYQPPSWVDPR